MIRKIKAQGFTLVELMIVVAIIGILAAIAIPNFLKYQLRSKSGEGPVNIAAIKTSEITYYGNTDNYAPCTANPSAGIPGATKAAFDPPSAANGWLSVAWQPEGRVYFQYNVTTTASSTAGGQFTAWGLADIDADATNQCVMFQHPDSANNVAAGGAACIADATKVSQVYKASTDGVF